MVEIYLVFVSGIELDLVLVWRWKFTRFLMRAVEVDVFVYAPKV